MSGEDKHSKTEQPTPKKLMEARNRSGPPRSRDLTSTVTLMAAILYLYSSGSLMVASLRETCRELLAGAGTFSFSAESVHTLLLKLMISTGLVLAPFLLVVIVAGIAINAVQGGIVLSWEKLSLNLDKLNPANGLGKLFNKDSLVEIAKSFLKILIVGYMAYQVIRGQEDSLIYLSDMDVEGILLFISRLAFRLVINGCGVLLLLALLDLAFVKWRYIQNLRMTKEEVKEENRQSEGDPQVKSKIRRVQYEQARKRLQKLIPTADVVITNPTHFAVALKYDREKMAAPIVIAKGADHLALRIREIAREHRVMLVENRPLARELYATVKEGHEIPESLYAAVAEVLAYVFGLKGKI